MIERAVDDSHVTKEGVWIGVIGGAVGRGMLDLEAVNRIEDGFKEESRLSIKR